MKGRFRFSGLPRTRFPKIDVAREPPEAIATRPTQLFLPAELEAPRSTGGYDREGTIPHYPRQPRVDSDSSYDPPC